MSQSKYIKQLEDLIMNDMLPMYLVGCTYAGKKPEQSKILSKLLRARKKMEHNSCYLLGFRK